MKCLKLKMGVASIILLICLTSFRADDRLKFYWGQTAIDLKSGISLAEIKKSDAADKLRYVVREDLTETLSNRSTEIEINLIRGGVSLYSHHENVVLASKTLQIQKIFSEARAGDSILLELKGVEGVLPQIIGLHIFE